VNRRLIARGNPLLDITSFPFQPPFEDFNLFIALCPAVKDDKATAQKHKYFLNARHSAAIWAHVPLSRAFQGVPPGNIHLGVDILSCAQYLYSLPLLFVIKMKCILNQLQGHEVWLPGRRVRMKGDENSAS
jgi:hypothetical protein